MKKLLIFTLILATSFGFAEISRAEISIDQLIEQARITEGKVAVRDLPRWNGARKILIWDIGMGVTALAESLPDVEFILVPSVAEAMQHASDVDAIIGFCDPDLIAAASNLVWLQIYSAGA